MRFTLLILIAFIISSCTSTQHEKLEINPTQETETTQNETIPQEDTLVNFTKKILSIIKSNDLKAFAQYIHPKKGVRFSPYAYVDTTENILLKKTDFIENLSKKYFWGYYDGSGEEISLTINDYFKEFVYDVDFIHAEEIKVDTLIGTGNSLNNMNEVYTNHHFVECYFSGFDPAYDGLDWRSLRLVFETYENKMVLIAIIHDQWTI